jgi:hypothetical protein
MNQVDGQIMGDSDCAMLKINTKEEIKSNQSEGNAYQFVALTAQVALLKLHNKIQFVEVYLLLMITYLLMLQTFKFYNT